MKIAHVINVTEITESKKPRYLHIAQPLTLRSMVDAQKFASDAVDVQLVAVKHKDENVSIPPEFVWAADLDTYAWEHISALQSLIPHRPLPRLGDIILRLYNASDAEYFIYTNIDIGLSRQFYLEVRNLITLGHDAFCINRMNLPKEYGGMQLDEHRLGLIYEIEGTRHPGVDCFIFKREIVPLLKLGNAYTGYPPVGQVMRTQIEVNSKNFIWIKDKRLTFHLGSDRAWRNVEDPYYRENMKQSTGLYVRQSDTSAYERFRNKLKSSVRQTVKANVRTWRDKHVTKAVRTITTLYRLRLSASVRQSLLVSRLKSLLKHNWLYSPDYYQQVVEGPAVRSANTIADSIAEDFHVTRLVDVGCGTGALLEKFRDRGCEVFGLEYSEAALKYCHARNLDVAKFNLERDEYTGNRSFDVAVSMEVAEHLPENTANRYLDLLTRLARVIVFTAAPPGQGGNDHVNEQPPDYWITRFQQRGFSYNSELSERWREDWKASGHVEWWYHQNLMIFQRA